MASIAKSNLEVSRCDFMVGEPVGRRGGTRGSASVKRMISGVRVGWFGRTLAASVFSLTTGCATIGSGQPVHSDVPVGTGEQEQPSGETVDVEQSGTTLTLRSRKLCDVHETRDVVRTTTTTRENKSAWTDWTLGVGGAALVGAGAVTLIDSGSVGNSDQTSKTYNPVGGTGAIALGAGLIALGVAGGTIAIVDAFRAGGSDESKARVTLPGRELRHGVACKTPVPVANVELALLLPRARGETDDRIALGKTGSDGVLRVDLGQELPDNLGSSAKAHVMRETSEVGTVDLLPVHGAREASAYRKLDRSACASPKKSVDCAPLVAFLRQYPKSAHAPEVRQILENAHSTLTALEDAEAWAETNADGCARPAGRDIVGAENMCDQLQRYIDAYPNGKHVAEAKAAIAKGRPAIKRAQDDATRVAREEEAAQKRREQQEAEKARNALRASCNAKCNVMCSRRVNPGMCLSGCVELCVKQGEN